MKNQNFMLWVAYSLHLLFVSNSLALEWLKFDGSSSHLKATTACAQWVKSQDPKKLHTNGRIVGPFKLNNAYIELTHPDLDWSSITFYLACEITGHAANTPEAQQEYGNNWVTYTAVFQSFTASRLSRTIFRDPSGAPVISFPKLSPSDPLSSVFYPGDHLAILVLPPPVPETPRVNVNTEYWGATVR